MAALEAGLMAEGVGRNIPVRAWFVLVTFAAIVASGFSVAVAHGSRSQPGPGDALVASELVVASETRPSPRFGARMIYHAPSDRVLLLGGRSGGPPDVNDMWEYDVSANQWTEIHPATMPPPGVQTGLGPMAYDSQSDRVVLFENGETWAYDPTGNTWENLRPSRAPPVVARRLGTRM